MNEPLQVPAWVLISALRYAFGRASYIVSQTCSLVRDQWPNLSPTTQQAVFREIGEHLDIIGGANTYERANWVELYNFCGNSLDWKR